MTNPLPVPPLHDPITTAPHRPTAPTVPTRRLRLRCPRDTDPAFASYHHAYDILIPHSVAVAAVVAMLRCQCGSDFVVDRTPETAESDTAPTTPPRDDAHRAAVSADMGDFLRGTVPVGSVWVHTNGNRYVVAGLPDVDLGDNVWVPGVLYHREGDPSRAFVRDLAAFRGNNGAGVQRFARVEGVR